MAPFMDNFQKNNFCFQVVYFTMLEPINIKKTQECGFGDIVHAMFNVLIK
jgi:hypothetical protein